MLVTFWHSSCMMIRVCYSSTFLSCLQIMKPVSSVLHIYSYMIWHPATSIIYSLPTEECALSCALCKLKSLKTQVSHIKTTHWGPVSICIHAEAFEVQITSVWRGLRHWDKITVRMKRSILYYGTWSGRFCSENDAIFSFRAAARRSCFPACVW